MSHFPTGVAVVTTRFEGKRYGMTISSFCPVSLDPPLALYCLSKTANRFQPFFKSNDFVINILDETSAETSVLFSKNDFSAWEEEFDDNLELKKATWCIYCTTQYRYEGGDHKIIVALVRECKPHISKAPPLIYYKSDYHSMK
ncbi:flavin reductase like domain protein [Neorickettsia helminthoeca str. Oregon]|uniref:Flavin reductase like domain protein n=2 Tax=Neorickettsia helminthoeca TaxID=33994 RepID=X5HMJ6_9RICK|nr:flavin reductase like domain protein [Neorickettsia helminthoeca str. Oregon]